MIKGIIHKQMYNKATLAEKTNDYEKKCFIINSSLNIYHLSFVNYHLNEICDLKRNSKISTTITKIILLL